MGLLDFAQREYGFVRALLRGLCRELPPVRRRPGFLVKCDAFPELSPRQLYERFQRGPAINCLNLPGLGSRANRSPLLSTRRGLPPASSPEQNAANGNQRGMACVGGAPVIRHLFPVDRLQQP